MFVDCKSSGGGSGRCAQHRRWRAQQPGDDHAAELAEHHSYKRSMQKQN